MFILNLRDPSFLAGIQILYVHIICTYVSLQKTNIFLDLVFCAYVHYIYAVCVQESYYIPNDDDDDWKRTTYNIHTTHTPLPPSTSFPVVMLFYA